MAPRKCEWCDEIVDDTNGYLTEDGKYWTCSEDCFNSLEQNFAEQRDDERFQHAYYEATRGV